MTFSAHLIQKKGGKLHDRKKFEKLLRTAAERLPTSSVIMSRVLADVKLQQILKRGGSGRPIIILYGSPGNGKTSSVQALLADYREIKFACGLKNVKKILADMMEKREVPVLFLDNFPQPLSAYKLEVGRRILDHVIDVTSEDAEAPITIITGEPNILEEIQKVEYLAGRSLVVMMPKIDEDEELFDIRRYFSLHRQEYLEMWKLYDQWAEQNPPSETDILQELETFRDNYCAKYDNRQVGLVFNYFYAMRRFSEFLGLKYEWGISLDAIQANVQALLDWRESSKSSTLSYEIEVWNEFLKDGGISHVFTPRLYVCERLLETNCDFDRRYVCRVCEGDFVEKYHPMDLRLPENPAAVILLETTRMIPYFPRHIPYDGAILTIRYTSLIEMLNMYLENYSRKNGVSVRRITPKKMTKELFSHNMCLFEYVEIGHNTYTFPMRDRNNESIRVVFIKLTQEQCQQLKKNLKEDCKIANYNGREVRDMIHCIKYFCENVQSLCGDIGAPSMVFEEER